MANRTVIVVTSLPGWPQGTVLNVDDATPLVAQLLTQGRLIDYVPAAGGTVPTDHNAVVRVADLEDGDSPAIQALRTTPGTTGTKAGHRLVGLGDSITAAGEFLQYLSMLSGGRIRFVRNAGVGGNQIDQMLARFDTDVAPYKPTMVSLLGGTNDYTFGATDSQFRQRVRAFVAKTRAIGAQPLLFTSPPCEVLADPDRAKIPRNNAWLAAYAASQGIALVDAYAVLADPVGYGNYLNAYDNGDGIHPSDAGHLAIAQAAAAVLNPLLPPVPVHAATNADPSNLLTNGLMAIDANADGWADSWGQSWGLDAGTWNYSIVTDPQMPGGKAQRTALTGATGHVSRTQDVSTGFATGDTLRLTALATTATGTYLDVTVEGPIGTTVIASQRIPAAITRGLVDLTVTVPAGVTAVRVNLSPGALTTGVTGNVDVGAVTLRNETALGLLAP